MAVSIGAPADARVARRLAEHGVHTQAVVTEVEIHHGLSGDPLARLGLRFQDDLARTLQTTINYCRDTSKYGIGDKVEIRYDRDDPDVANFVECSYPTTATAALIVGVIAIVIGTLLVIFVWHTWGWRRWWIGIPVSVFGGLFAATSFEDDCDCGEAVYISAALVLIGLVAVVGSRFRRPG